MKRTSALVALVVSFSIVVSLIECSSALRKGKAMKNVKFPQKPPVESLYDSEAVNDKSKWGALGTHDPGIYKDGDTYYVFSTDARVGGIATPGIQVRKSKDLINWQYVGTAFNDGLPLMAVQWSNATGIWAPDVTKFGDTYYLYYSASTFGSNRSFIGVATSKSIEGPWVDQGEVVKTDLSSGMNAIDPNIVCDAEGNPWLAYGSFWTGIYILKIDKNTGKPSEQVPGKHIAGRNSSVSGAIEGSYIIYNPDYKKYYLFVSYDSLSADYNVRVGRADKIDGPYLDSNGNDMTNTSIESFKVGNKVLGGYKFEQSEGWIAPGHNSVLKDGNNYFIIHHARAVTDSNWFYMHVRKILWSEDGWPMVSPERFAGEREQKLNKDIIPGQWQKIILHNFDNGQIASKPLKLLPDGNVEGQEESMWEFKEDNTLVLNLYTEENNENETFNCKVMPSWDWENGKATLVFTGIDSKGTSIWGKMIK